MKTENYNGWCNYETWCVSLWLNNDISSYRRWKAEAEQALKDAPDSTRVKEWGESVAHAARGLLAEKLSEEFYVDDWEAPDLYSDLVKSALEKVDWLEVAADFLEDLSEAETNDTMTTADEAGCDAVESEPSSNDAVRALKERSPSDE